MALDTNWCPEDLVSRLSEFRRLDDGRDSLAFRLAGRLSHRSLYAYMYGDDPDVIGYDLEDELSHEEWDHAVERGEVRSVEELLAVARRWLDGP